MSTVIHDVWVHGHELASAPEDVIYYLRHLSESEAKAIFEYAYVHGSTDFEFTDIHHVRHDATVKKSGGKYDIEMR